MEDDKRALKQGWWYAASAAVLLDGQIQHVDVCQVELSFPARRKVSRLIEAKV